jgi:hypothetical protein
MTHCSARSRIARRAALVACLILLGAARAASAQHGAGTSGHLIARTFELRARDGFARQLDDGYRRHLDWHVAAGDRWAWYLWEVSNGERHGLYVDGTFDRRWADFDAAVDPRGDRADNAVNVDPFATRAANHVWRLRPELGGAPVDPELAPLVLRSEYRVRPGADSAFTAGLERLRGAAGARPYAVYELVSGGERPTYVVWVPAATWAEAGAFTDEVASVARALATSADRVREELWRFRPDLSTCRTAAARCYRTLSPERAPTKRPTS